MSTEQEKARASWFVGASYGAQDDQTSRFLRDGTWDAGSSERYVGLIKSIVPGDRIAIKSSYTRKHGLPFDNRDQTVSVMAIKAVGTVKANPGDGRTLQVEWDDQLRGAREWYFYTHRGTVWRVLPWDWKAEGLLDFAFSNKPQDIDRFRNDPYWQERFGEGLPEAPRFAWTQFYEKLADGLLTFRNRRAELVGGIHKIASQVGGLSNLQDQFRDGTSGPLTDICPFTAMGIFNRGITLANRRAIASALGELVGVAEPAPESFDGVPILNNQKSWFFRYEKNRDPDDIDTLWEIFARAIEFADGNDADAHQEFMQAYDEAARRYNVGWNLTMGLYWLRPWSFPTLDERSRAYIFKILNHKIGTDGPSGRCSGANYLALAEILQSRFQEEFYPHHSFPELSFASWQYRDNPPQLSSSATEYEDGSEKLPISVRQIKPYSIDDILHEGCFVPRDALDTILERLIAKKNLILQGPPGTGKTWLAKRLAYALMGEVDESRVKAVQFHPNVSYEDFIRGWRPAGDGKLALIDGPFMEMIAAAEKDTARHIVLIEEINRGNPAQIFGEMLTLLEADKRTPSERLELSYRRFDGERVHIPQNLYVIGTMNIADRSLALVDLALRRRFAFIDLVPTLGPPWRDWVHSKFGIDLATLSELERRIRALNDEISSDTGLGDQFRIGHSYVTPRTDMQISDPRAWFRQVVDTEIGPLLEEYWFDNRDKARKAKERLLDGL